MSSQSQQIFPFFIGTKKTKKQVISDYTKFNPLRIPMYVNGLELIMDSEFQEKASVQIVIDNVIRFDSRDEENSLKGRLKFSIPLGIILPRDAKIEVFVWNEKDRHYLECEFNLFLDETLKTITSESVPLSSIIYNQMVSETEILFEKKTYNNEVRTKLLNMSGYKKLIVNMSASDYSNIAPKIISNPDKYGNINNIVDGNFATKTDTKNISSSNKPLTDKFTVIVDFGSIASRLLVCKIRSYVLSLNVNFSATAESKLFVSDDNILYTEIDSLSQIALPRSSANDKTIELKGDEQSFRYVKFEVSFDRENVSNIFRSEIFEIYNANCLGGTASLSFEELDITNNTFTDLIPSSEFGTITQRQSVKRQIGDVNNVSLTGKTYFLPSTQSGFRAVLTITGGGINTGVSIRKIA